MKFLSTAEFSKATGIATGTLRRWATDRKLIPAKMQGKGQPSFYSEDQLQAEIVINFKPRNVAVQLGTGGLSLNDRVNRIRKLTGDACRNMIEIGKHLIAAKAEVEHGNWANWLEENFGWTDRTARNFMAVADRFGDMDVADFKPSTLQALLALPVGSEQGFIAEQAALGKPVETQSARELKANVRQANQERANGTKRKTFSDLEPENRAITPTLTCSPVLEQVADTPAPAIEQVAPDLPTMDDVKLPSAQLEPVANGDDTLTIDLPAEDSDALPDMELINEQAILKRAVGYLTKAADNAPRLKEFFDGIITQLDAKQAEIHAQQRRQKN